MAHDYEAERQKSSPGEQRLNPAVLSRRRRTLLLMGAVGHCGCVLERDTQPVLLDPHRSTIADDTVIRGHQLELFRNGDRVSNLDGGAFWRNVDNFASRAKSHM
jgi:hypothetical protein